MESFPKGFLNQYARVYKKWSGSAELEKAPITVNLTGHGSVQSPGGGPTNSTTASG